MKELREEQELLGDARMTDNEILTTTLGHRSGYARGQGYRAEPFRKRDRSTTSQASIDQMRLELEQSFDKKLQEKLQEEQQKYEEKLAAMEQKMEERFAALMEKIQTNAS